MSIWTSSMWLEGTRGNYGEPDGGPWVVHLATATSYGERGLIRVAVIERNNVPGEISAEAVLTPTEALRMADELVVAVRECERARG
jgi:hypothetical protein